MKYTIKELIRSDILALTPYSSARSEFTGDAKVFLDANENWQQFVGYRDVNRYPDPLQRQLKAKIEAVLGLPSAKLVVGNGSDEIIDLLFRVFCTPFKDKAMVLIPTYGAYQVFADINGVAVSTCQLKDDFSIDFQRLETICQLIHGGTPATGMHKLLFICSPNNPTGTIVPLDAIERIARGFPGIVVVDEAYHDFAGGTSAVSLMERYPHLVVLRTLSKAWGLAGARVGLAVADEEIVAAMNKVKYPYNMSLLAQQCAMDALDKADQVRQEVRRTITEREKLSKRLKQLAFVEEVVPSQANFVLVRVRDADCLYAFLRDKGIIVRNRSSLRGCYGCVRITVGSSAENETLMTALQEWEGLR